MDALEKGKFLIFHLTCVVKNCVFDGAIFKEGVCRLDVLKVAVLEQRVLKLDRFNLNVGKPECRDIHISKPHGTDRQRPTVDETYLS